MTHALGPEGSRSLAVLARSRALLAFDYDGTLAPIVGDRDRAGMSPRTREILARVCALYPCAVISGRSRGDVMERVAGSGVRYVVGNHGLEPWPGQEGFARAAQDARGLLEEDLRGRPGVDIEDKHYTLAVHYRHAPDRDEACRAIGAAVASLPRPMRAVPGKLVVNVVPGGAPDKGDALRRLKRQEGSDAALYVGDDVTDEDAFRLAATGEAMSVRVGESSSSAASHYVRDREEVDLLLERLVALRGDGAPAA